MAADERVWLLHPDTGGYFECPVGAIEHWTEMGFKPSDPPPVVNPAVVEMLAAQQAMAEQQQDSAPAPVADEPTTRKPRAGAGSTTEGSDHGA